QGVRGRLHLIDGGGGDVVRRGRELQVHVGDGAVGGDRLGGDRVGDGGDPGRLGQRGDCGQHGLQAAGEQVLVGGRADDDAGAGQGGLTVGTRAGARSDGGSLRSEALGEQLLGAGGLGAGDLEAL